MLDNWVTHQKKLHSYDLRLSVLHVYSTEPRLVPRLRPWQQLADVEGVAGGGGLGGC